MSSGAGIVVGGGLAVVIVIGTGAGVVIVIATVIGIVIVIGIGVVFVIGFGFVVLLNGLSYSESSYCAGSWWGHEGGYPLGLSSLLKAPGKGYCPPSVSIL